MEDLEQQLMNTSDGENADVQAPPEQTPPQEPPQEDIKTELSFLKEPEPAEPNPDTPPIQDFWKKTKQFEQGLWKTPDDIYNSVKYYEQKFQPLEQAIKRMGFKEPAELEQAFRDYSEKMPSYQANEQTINLLNALLQNDVYGSKLRAVFDEIRTDQEQQRYGIAFNQLPENLKEKLTKGEQAFQQLEQLKQQQAEDGFTRTIQDQIAQVQQTAQNYGFEVDTQKLLEYCRDNNINPDNIYGEFLRVNFPAFMEKAKQNASFATLNQNKQNKAKAVSTSSKVGGNADKEIKSFEDLESKLLEQI